MVSKDTGFHPSDADYTRGRSLAVSNAEAIARRQMGLARAVKLTTTKEADHD